MYCNKDDAVGGGGPRLVLSVPFFLSFLFCFVMFFVLFLILLSLELCRFFRVGNQYAECEKQQFLLNRGCSEGLDAFKSFTN